MSSPTKEVKAEANLRINRFRFSTRLNYLIFPIDGRTLAEALERAGFTVPKILPAPPRARIGFSGEMGRKGDLVLDGNSETQVLGVTAKSYESAMNGFAELKEAVSTCSGVDLDQEGRFYEIIVEFEINSAKSPLGSVEQVFRENQLLKNAGSILGEDVSLFTVRLVSKGKVPNQEEWLDVTLEPDILMPTKKYLVSVIFRSKDKSKVQAFGSDVDQKLVKLIGAIEGPANA